MSRTDDAVFRRRTLLWMVGIGLASFAGAVALIIFGDELAVRRSVDSDPFSASAIGHGALVEALRELDVPVVVSVHDSAAKAERGGALVIAAPSVLDVEGPRAAELEAMLRRAPRALLVLPKWYGVADTLRPSWLAEVGLLELDEVAAVAEAAGIEASVVRPEASPALVGDGWPAPTLVVPQLIEAHNLEPVIAAGDQALLGVYRFAGRTLWVLSDPDVLDNHGLGRGDNALLAARLIDELRGDTGGGVVFDATLHGFAREPTLWRTLFEFPLALATLSVLLAAALLLWAATGRFGKPVPVAAPIEPGKQFLIHNTAALLRVGGHVDHVLARYLSLTVRDVAAALHAPAQLEPAARATWLERIATARGVSIPLAQLEREVGAARTSGAERARAVVAIARRIHQWRQEMIHGPIDPATHG